MNQLVQTDRIKKVRTFVFDIIKDLSTEQFNKIPQGFSNNIAWHMGHLIAAQQGICYLRAGLPPVVPEHILLQYKPGTKPESLVSDEELASIKELFFTSIDRLESDISNNVITNYNTWTTRYGVEITSIDDALGFLLFHEGLHSGYITYMKRLIA